MQYACPNELAPAIAISLPPGPCLFGQEVHALQPSDETSQSSLAALSRERIRIGVPDVSGVPDVMRGEA